MPAFRRLPRLGPRREQRQIFILRDYLNTGIALLCDAAPRYQRVASYSRSRSAAHYRQKFALMPSDRINQNGRLPDLIFAVA